MEDLQFKKEKDEKRFWAKIKVLGENDCWNWIAKKDKDGYGRFYLNKKQVGAHRVSYFLFFGKINEGMLICHKCNNASCVNPNHLYEGTSQENVKDSVLAGTCYFTNARGEKCPNSKLKLKEVLEIRRLIYKGVKQSLIAKMFKVSDANITLIKNEKNWKL